MAREKYHDLAEFLSSTTAAAITFRLIDRTTAGPLLIAAPMCAAAAKLMGLVRTQLLGHNEGRWERVAHGAVAATLSSYFLSEYDNETCRVANSLLALPVYMVAGIFSATVARSILAPNLDLPETVTNPTTPTHDDDSD